MRSYKALKSFHRTVVGSSIIAGLVRHLDLSLRYSKNVDARVPARRRSGPDDDEGNRKMVTPIDFAALVPRLVRLESLETRDLDPSLLEVVFLNQDASRRLESLKKLAFSKEYGLFQYGCDVDAWLERLAGLPRLADLTLRQADGDDPILPHAPVPPTFPRLTHLVLQQGMLDEAGWPSPALDQMAPSLVHLELEGRCTGWFAGALASAPVGLRILSLYSTDADGWDTFGPPINGVMARLQNLERLSLCRGAFDTSLPSGLADLVVLDKLVYLAFEASSTAPDTFLLALLKDSDHVPNLAILELKHVESAKGNTVEYEAGAIPPFEERGHYPHWPMWNGWVAPEYPVGVTEQGLLAVVQAARARGVVVKGSAYDALYWRNAFEAEQRVALFALGDLTGEYRRARDVLGAEAVNAHILARSIASFEGGERGEVGEA